MRTEDSSWKESNPLNVTNLNRGVMIDQFGCVVIEVPYNSRQPIEKQFASIFFEPKVKNPEIQAPKIRKDSLTDAEKRIKELENTPVKRIKIVIKYLRPKLKDLKTAVLPAPSTNVRKSLFNLRIISSLLRDLPKPPPPPPRSRFSSANSSYSHIGFYMRSSHPEPPPIKRRPSVVTKTSSIYLQE